MTPEQQAAYIIAQSACMLAEMEAMKAANVHRAGLGAAQEYGEAAFAALPGKYGLQHNTVIGWSK